MSDNLPFFAASILARALQRQGHNSSVLYTEATPKRLVYSDYLQQDRELIEDAVLIQDLAIAQAARILDLEAQLAALRNPPYRIEIEAPEGGFSDCGYQYTIYPQRAAIKVDDGFETELAAREAAQQFINSLKAPKE